MKVITFTKVALPYGWLGNMAPYSIAEGNLYYPTAEHYFQLARLPAGHPAFPKVLKSKSPMAAKIVVAEHEKDFVVERLGVVDIANMRRTLRLKFTQHPALLDALLATENTPIVEDVSARQNKGAAMFWGGVPVHDSSSNVPWVGKNMLGQLLMELREIMQKQEKGLG